MIQSVILIGATGLIGQQILHLLLHDERITKVKILVRKPFKLSHSKLEIVIVDFNNIENFRSKMGTADAIFCAVGTTQQKVKGDKDAYEKVDYDIPYNAAILGKEAGVRKFLLVSSVGANEQSGNFYLQLKGKTENAIGKIDLYSIHFFRPSMLLGDRKESRPGESIGKALMQSFSFAFVGRLKKYKPVHAKKVAAAMVNAAFKEEEGVFVHHYDEIRELSKGRKIEN